jgi:DNA topoisomerase-2
VEIDAKANSISVMNNGKGLPVVMHKEHKVYVPELVFGHLLTSDNYNDGDCKVVGGRNGYGAKLANVFSTEFVIETADGQKKYSQTFQKNLSVKKEPKIVNSKESSQTQSV